MSSKRSRSVCTCLAYPWPHRAGAGKCDSTPIDTNGTFYCGTCGRECDVVETIFKHAISSCCGAEVYTDSELTEPFEE
jgi:hypothetical protein